MSKLSEIEKEISDYVKVDKSNWIRIYRLMDEVDTNKLYVEREDTPSFTAWVNWLAGSLGVHVSLLWSRKKAGKVYDEYYKRAETKQRPVPSLETVNVSPDSLNLCEKVAGKNASEMDRLIERVVAGELTRDDLRAAVRAKRATSSADSLPKSRHNRIDAECRTETDDNVTAADIVMALRRSGWLAPARVDNHFSHVYHVFPEFKVDTGTSRHARRVDALIAETVTAYERDEVILRGIEIKVDVHDLESDHKMAEYTAYCDYFYVAIPSGDEEMLTSARELILPTWGIISVTKEGRITVEKEPERLNALFRDKAMATCLIKLMAGQK